MAARPLTERVEILEQKVGDLQELPARTAAVESQILQLRGEMREGFSAIHARLGTHDQQFESIDRRFESMDRRFESMDRRFDSIDQRFDSIDQRFEAIDQRSDERFVSIMQRLDELKTHMLVLHEEALSRISVTKEAPIQEGRKRKKR